MHVPLSVLRLAFRCYKVREIGKKYEMLFTFHFPATLKVR